VSGGIAPAVSQLPINVNGRQVMLYAPNGSIGSTAANLDVSFTTADFSALTPEIKTKLSLAGPGDLTVTTSTTGGVTQYTMSLVQTNLVVAGALGPISAKAKSSIIFIWRHQRCAARRRQRRAVPDLAGQLARRWRRACSPPAAAGVHIDAAEQHPERHPGQTVIAEATSPAAQPDCETRASARRHRQPGRKSERHHRVADGRWRVPEPKHARAARRHLLPPDLRRLVVGNLFGGNASDKRHPAGGVRQHLCQAAVLPEETARCRISSASRSTCRAEQWRRPGYGASYQPLQRVSVTRRRADR
jgi:hypothetical protein